jgi:hypothetical protein
MYPIFPLSLTRINIQLFVSRPDLSPMSHGDKYDVTYKSRIYMYFHINYRSVDIQPLTPKTPADEIMGGIIVPLINTPFHRFGVGCHVDERVVH